ncbi:MAG: hypothetical protein A2X86_01175 [Bdellovibrionales bacterium GWA2_49_15]|nr:MAG: hypothetical protein A2X86_01175 [Bdellovibrionales bacterium GWA2_49_15]HAZ12164.1 hypothetical protein [Bdellovibrionales bacterium]
MSIWKIIIFIVYLVFIQYVFADVVPKNPRAGDRYIKVTKVEKNEKFCNLPKKKYTFMRFEVCEIDKVEKDASNKNIITDRICRPVNQGSERTLYLPHRLNELRRKMVDGSQISMFMGIFMVGTTWGDAVQRHRIGKALRRQIIQDQDVIFHDSATLSYDEEKALEGNPNNEVSYFDYFLESMQNSFKAYDKDYKNICAIEKDPAPVLPPPVIAPSLASRDSSQEVISLDAQGRRSCVLQ